MGLRLQGYKLPRVQAGGRSQIFTPAGEGQGTAAAPRSFEESVVGTDG